MKRFLLSAAAVALLAGPLAARVQPDQRQDRHAAQTRPDRQVQVQRAAPVRPETRAPQFRQFGGQNRGAPVQRFQPDRFQAQPQRFQPTPLQPAFAGDRRAPDNRFGQDRWAPTRPPAGFAAHQAYQNGWNRGAQYQRDANWWRERRGFEAYEGRRDGFWFAPGYGYYRPDPRWYGYNWTVGFTVPYELRNYYVSDPYDYGLPPAPYGCEWIFLGNQLVLINVETGQIVQMGFGY